MSIDVTVAINKSIALRFDMKNRSCLSKLAYETARSKSNKSTKITSIAQSIFNMAGPVTCLAKIKVKSEAIDMQKTTGLYHKLVLIAFACS